MKYCKPEIIVLDSPKNLAIKGASHFVERAKGCVKKRGSFFVALSGGSTPKAMHRLLMERPYRCEIPWHGVQVFWVDERCVPLGDPASNFGTAKKDFIDHVPIPGQQVHPMPGDMEPELGALAYEKDLAFSFCLKEGELPTFDLIFLGVGADGHTASLFPGQKALKEKKTMVVAVSGGDPLVNRLTLTLPVFNHAREIVFLVSGKEKAPIVKAAIQSDPSQFPVQRIQPQSGMVTWLLDRDAASLL